MYIPTVTHTGYYSDGQIDNEMIQSAESFHFQLAAAGNSSVVAGQITESGIEIEMEKGTIKAAFAGEEKIDTEDPANLCLQPGKQLTLQTEDGARYFLSYLQSGSVHWALVRA